MLTKVGLIPAHAGKTLSRLVMLLRARAHPRSRGENFEATDKTVDDEGSSPLTRGKLLESRAFDVLSGLIPAHAGKTKSRSSRPT